MNDTEKKALGFLSQKLPYLSEYKTAFVLGSGLSYLGEMMENNISINFSEIPGFPQSTVMGHKGKLIFGKLLDKNILIMSGRVHYYEGYSIEEVIFPVNLLSACGVENLVLTNAAGGINPSFKPGDLMLITDIINNLYIKPEINKFTTPVLSNKLNKIILKAADNIHFKLKKGVYAAMTGPVFETPSEVKYLDFCGTDAVGMSTVPTITKSSELNIEVSGISCITNLAAGISKDKLTHEEVSETADKVKDNFINLLKEIINLL